MGSYAITCAISKLPIHGGEQVKVLLLTGCPYVSEHSNIWYPRTAPIDAFYDDYGSIENVYLGPASDLWLQGLDLDLIEKSWGRDTYDTYPVKRGMSFSDLLIVLDRDLLRVVSHYDDMPDWKFSTFLPPKEVNPFSVENVTKIIQDAGLDLYDGETGFTISSELAGEIIVIYHDRYKLRLDKLNAAQELMKDFATVIRAGTYQSDATLAVYTKPGTTSIIDHSKRDKIINARELPVKMCIIRKDVWDIAIKGKNENYAREDYTIIETPIDAYYKDAEEVYYAYKAKLEDGNLGAITSWFKIEYNTLISSLISIGSTRNRPYSVGILEHIELMTKMNPTDKQLDYFIKSIGELAFVDHMLRGVRINFEPCVNVGPQYGGWKDHLKWHNKLEYVIKKKIREEKQYE